VRRGYGVAQRTVGRAETPKGPMREGTPLSFAIIPSCALDLLGTGFLGLHPDGSPLIFD
jgi:hypothetical protein